MLRMARTQRHQRVTRGLLTEDEAASRAIETPPNASVGRAPALFGGVRMVKTPSIIALVSSTAPDISAGVQPGARRSATTGGEHCGDDADRQVDEEDPVPVDGLGQHAAGEQPDRAAG